MVRSKPKITPDDAVNMVRVAQLDPVGWVRGVLGAKPWAVQCALLESLRDNAKTACKACHGSGKSWIAARGAIWYLLAHPNSLVITTAPTFRQVRDIVWKEIRTAHAGAKKPLGGKLLPVEPRLELAPGWLAFGFATRLPDQFQGLHAGHVLVVADEGPGIPAPIWEAIEGVLSAGNTRLLTIGNPVDPVGAFFEMCRPGSGAKVLTISAFDTPNFTTFGITADDIAGGTWREKITDKLPMPFLVTPEWVADRYDKWGPTSPMYLSRVLGEFPQSATDALIPLAWVEAAQRRWETEPAGEPVVLAGDIARFGSDESVAILRRGRRAELLWTTTQEDTMQTAGRFTASMRKHEPAVTVVDEIGVGAGVVDRLREVGAGRVVGLNSGAAPRDGEQFANARAEWWWGLRELFEAGEIAIPPDDELAAQLTSLKYKFTSAGKVLIESKDDMRKRGLASPDRADTLMLAFARGEASGEIILPGKVERVQRKWEDWPDEDKPRRRHRWM